MSSDGEFDQFIRSADALGMPTEDDALRVKATLSSSVSWRRDLPATMSNALRTSRAAASAPRFRLRSRFVKLAALAISVGGLSATTYQLVTAPGRAVGVSTIGPSARVRHGSRCSVRRRLATNGRARRQRWAEHRPDADPHDGRSGEVARCAFSAIAREEHTPRRHARRRGRAPRRDERGAPIEASVARACPRRQARARVPARRPRSRVRRATCSGALGARPERRGVRSRFAVSVCASQLSAHSPGAFVMQRIRQIGLIAAAGLAVFVSMASCAQSEAVVARESATLRQKPRVPGRASYRRLPRTRARASAATRWTSSSWSTTRCRWRARSVG